MTSAKQREKLKALGWECNRSDQDFEKWCKLDSMRSTVLVFEDGIHTVTTALLSSVAEFAAVLKEEAE